MKNLLFSAFATLLLLSPFVSAHHVEGHNGTYFYDRLSAENSAFLFVDHQAGLAQGIRDQMLSEYFLGIKALVQIAKIFKVPCIISSSHDIGPNGPILDFILEELPEAQVIRRQGEINAFDSSEFKSAVAALNKSKIVISGISTDVCVAFAALSGVELGYQVYAVYDASGTFSAMQSGAAITRMSMAGVNIMSWFAVGCELLVDWRNATGTAFRDLLHEYLPFYGNLIDSYNHHTNQSSGEIIPEVPPMNETAGGEQMGNQTSSEVIPEVPPMNETVGGEQMGNQTEANNTASTDD